MIDTPLAQPHILHLITNRARNNPDRVALRFLKDSSGGYETLTWSDVLRLAHQGLVALKSRGLNQGDRVLLILPANEAFVAGVLGALWAGIVPSILPPLPNQGSSAVFGAEWQNLITLFSPSAIMTDLKLPQMDLPKISSEELLKSAGVPSEAEDVPNANQICYIQVTSGSTGAPKGVALSWRAICANLEAMRQRLRMTPEDHGVSWLPMYHDMGFFGTFLLSLYSGASLTLMDTSFFVSKPLLWFRVMAQTRATITAVPPSALQAALNLLRRRPQPHLDLSSCIQFVVGSEPVPYRLIQIFREVLAPYGVIETALRPAYGLAEATLAVTIPPMGHLPRVDWVQAKSLEVDRKAVQTSKGKNGAQAWLSMGTPLSGVQISIVSETGETLPERHLGQIWLQSSSRLTAVLENVTLYPQDGEWLDTGDLGYLAGGELFVTGRRKDIIIRRGRNYSPERLEDLASLADGVTRAAAFGLYNQATFTEKIILLVETRSRGAGGANHRDQIRLSVRSHLRAAECEVDEVYIVPRRSLPQTTSGKIRRQYCRELFLQKAFTVGESA